MDDLWFFTDPFTENAQILYDLLFTKNFRAEALRARLDTGRFSARDIDLAAYRYVDDCHDAVIKAHDRHLFDALSYGETLPGTESSHLAEAIRILLEYGLDPNRLLEFRGGGEHANIMRDMMFVYNGYQAADAVAEMFRHGGNPSLLIDGNSLIRELNMDLISYLIGNMEFGYFTDAVVHFWMVFVGYGAKLEHGEETIDPVGDFAVANLRNHRQYEYGVIHSDRSEDGIEVCFFDRSTHWEVARF